MFSIENLSILRQEMKQKGLKAYLILTGDPHASEYACDYFLAERKFFCPFSGSAGQVLITLDNAYLFTDGRYWIQAERELEGSTISLQKVGDKGVLNFDAFIKKNKLFPLGTNLLLISENEYLKFKNNKIKVEQADFSYLVKDRGQLPTDKVFKVDENLFSLTYQKKIQTIIKKTKELGADANLVTTLDDIAWILNIRGNDVPCNPVFYSYLYISKKYGTHLFIDLKKIDFTFEGIEIHPYEDIFDFLTAHNKVKTLVDPLRVSALVYSYLKRPVNGNNPSYLMKAIKGNVEINNIKRIQAIDGVALLKFQKYLEEHIDDNLSEYDYSEKLKEFRYQNKALFELSFGTIAACGPNAAQMHYAPTSKLHSIVNKESMELLVDSGGQYYGGTTDTTRTFLVGKASEEFIKDYTLTLKAVINLSRTIFLDGSNGHTIDIRAREFMWENGMDYKCGTGHGVSYMLNVHEGPNGFRYKRVPERDDQANIVPGMVTTIEPGVYKQGKYGIRIENNLLCQKAFETTDGLFYKFETITYVPISLEAVDKNMLSDDDIKFINDYHHLVYTKLKPLIENDPDLVEFLKKKTQKIFR